jgi:hypothetical protein
MHENDELGLYIDSKVNLSENKSLPVYSPLSVVKGGLAIVAMRQLPRGFII